MLLRGLWYYALPGKELARAKLARKSLLGEPVVIGRGSDGRPFALRDICPHRGMPLSYGRIDGGEIECAYHGWRFDFEGTCTQIPSLAADQTRDISRICLRRFPCEERDGNIWIFMAAPDAEHDADPADIPRVPGFEGHGYRMAQTMVFPCHVDHAVVGLMDPAHGPFVHQSWWWRSRSSIHEKAKRFEPSPYGFRMARHRPSMNSRAYKIMGGAPETEISFRLPGVRIEHVRAGKHQFCGLTAVTPIDEARTEVNHVIYWSMPWLTVLKPLLGPFARTFLAQDRLVVERQQEGLAHGPPLMLIDDADVQAKWYYKLKEEFESARKEGRPFENPVRERVLRWRS